jgi:uncharacterized repeat protein (TIGR04138 family)
MAAELPAAYLAMLRSGPVGFPPACLEYLLHAILRASHRGDGFRDLTAAEACRAFHAQAAADFGAFADEAMARFGLRTFDDLGRAIFLLAEHGCLTLRDGESRADYAAAGEIRFANG